MLARSSAVLLVVVVAFVGHWSFDLEENELDVKVLFRTFVH